MKNSLGLLAALALLAAPAANATFIFSDVEVGADYVTFTIDGDMSGYVGPTISEQFSIVFRGGMYVGDPTVYGLNVWSDDVFDNKSLSFAGNTGGFDGINSSYDEYAWSQYGSGLSDAVATSRTITLSIFDAVLNPGATGGYLQFVWGNGSLPDSHTVLASIREFSTVPAPGALLLFGFGLLGIAIRRRKT